MLSPSKEMRICKSLRIRLTIPIVLRLDRSRHRRARIESTPGGATAASAAKRCESDGCESLTHTLLIQQDTESNEL